MHFNRVNVLVPLKYIFVLCQCSEVLCFVCGALFGATPCCVRLPPQGRICQICFYGGDKGDGEELWPCGCGGRSGCPMRGCEWCEMCALDVTLESVITVTSMAEKWRLVLLVIAVGLHVRSAATLRAEPFGQLFI